MPDDPAPGRVGSQAEPSPHHDRLLSPGQHTRFDWQRPDKLCFPAAVCSTNGFAVESPPQPSLELGHRVERAHSLSDDRLPEVQGKVLAVLLIHLSPRLVDRHLGVEDQAVEIEYEGTNHDPSLAGNPAFPSCCTYSRCLDRYSAVLSAVARTRG